MPTRVVKAGGSLFARHDFPGELRAWMRCQPRRPSVLIVGGGEYADQVRALDRQFGLPQETAHRLAIRGMSLLAWVIAQLNDDWIHVATWEDLLARLGAARSSSTFVFDPAEFLCRHESDWPGERLTIGWDVTSDSIAARVAQALQAEELVLLKSRLAPVGTVHEASRQGYFDRAFPRLVSARRFRCVDLPGGREVVYREGLAGVPTATTTTTDRPDATSHDEPEPRGA